MSKWRPAPFSGRGFTVNIDAKLIAIMTQQVSKIAELAKNNVRSNGIPANIADAISITKVEKTGNQYKISILVDTKKSPSAAAYEYGSGIHRTKGSPGLYPISAKNVPNLVFYWDKKGGWFVGPSLPHGHPGVQARPYLQPAVDQNIKTFRAELAKAFKDAVLSSTTKIEVIRAT